MIPARGEGHRNPQAEHAFAVLHPGKKTDRNPNLLIRADIGQAGLELVGALLFHQRGDLAAGFCLLVLAPCFGFFLYFPFQDARSDLNNHAVDRCAIRQGVAVDGFRPVAAGIAKCLD